MLLLQTLANWPPSIQGSRKWWAVLQDHRLVLACRPAAAAPQEGSAQKRDAKAAQSPSTAAGEEALIVEEIDLEGCRCACMRAITHADRCKLSAGVLHHTRQAPHCRVMG